jgi:hypothetical protein
MFENCWASELLDVINRGRQSDVPAMFGIPASNRCGAFECALFQSHANDHLAAAVPGR